MGVFQKLGIRHLGISTVDAITWIRQYGLKDGSNIFKSLLKSKSGFYRINATIFLNALWLRDNYSDKAIFNQVFYQQQYYISQLKDFSADYIIDAGANIGLASVYFSNKFPNAQIVSLEPELNNYLLLKKNSVAYSNIECLHAALWHTNETISIQNPDSLAASYIVESNLNASIKAYTVDDILNKRQWNRVDILKMDIEGAEKEIFSGNTDWLQQVKLLILELHDHYKPGATKIFFKALEPYDYQAYFHHENIFIFFN